MAARRSPCDNSHTTDRFRLQCSSTVCSLGVKTQPIHREDRRRKGSGGSAERRSGAHGGVAEEADWDRERLRSRRGYDR